MSVPDLDDVKAYLTGALGRVNSNVTDELLSEALASEAASQALSCRVPEDPDDFPAPLSWALKRRVQVALSMLSMPLGMPEGDMTSAPVVLPGRDPMVRRLEAPYRRLKVG